MQTELFSSIFTTTNVTVTLSQVLATLVTSLSMGLLLAFVYKYKTQYSKEFVVTLALLPSLIAIIIFLVNGNLGTSVAVAGAFSLIRFRSAAGSSNELLAVFLATAIGLATGMGFLLLAICFTVLLSFLMVLLENVPFLQPKATTRHILLTVPKEFTYDHYFEDILGSACKQSELLSVHYKKKKEVLVLEYVLSVTKNTSDHAIIEKIMATNPVDVVLHHQIPKKKRL
ncbi:DUF4956 domain-containing protein [Streptococcus cameli]